LAEGQPVLGELPAVAFGERDGSSRQASQ
jgi:hypothetical protein